MTPRARGSRGRGGFTLLEVMVALAVLAAAFMALADLGGSGLRNHAYARDLSTATLLARGKLAELEEKYEDLGFKDFDEQDEGDFSSAGRAEVKWRVELVRPNPSLSADQLVAQFTGAGDSQQLLSGLFGGGAAGGAQSGSTTTTSATAGLAGQMLQTQLTAFGEKLKKSVREMRLTVSWNDGKPRSFTITEHLVVLNPRAPGGARGDSPDVPPNLAAQAQAASAIGQAAGALGARSSSGTSGTTQPGTTTPGTTTQPGGTRSTR